jgi:ribosomal protein S3AE
MAPKKPLRKKYFPVELPLIKEQYDASAYTLEDLDNKTVKIDMTRKLKGKSINLVFKIKIDKDQAIAHPKKLVLLPFFIKHMLRKNISYIEDSIKAETKESNILIKPFLITRKRVSRAVRRTIRNSARNWILDYTKEKKDQELFEEILSGKLQKPLSLKIKKIYPLALCEIRVLEIKKPLKKETKEKEIKKK